MPGSMFSLDGLTCQPSQHTLQDCHEPEFQILKFTVRASNTFFRICRAHGVFIPDPDRMEAVAASQYMCDSRLINCVC